jgi:hypothetical protein
MDVVLFVLLLLESSSSYDVLGVLSSSSSS